MSARYLLDTNVVSETRKVRPNPHVVAFLGQQTSVDTFVSALTIGELREGVKTKRRTDPTAADELAAWVDSIETTFKDRVLPVDAGVATLWGELSADRSRSVVDTLLAATAMIHGLTFATRNKKDVADLGLGVFDPFEPATPSSASSRRG